MAASDRRISNMACLWIHCFKCNTLKLILAFFFFCSYLKKVLGVVCGVICCVTLLKKKDRFSRNRTGVKNVVRKRVTYRCENVVSEEVGS